MSSRKPLPPFTLKSWPRMLTINVSQDLTGLSCHDKLDIALRRLTRHENREALVNHVG